MFPSRELPARAKSLSSCSFPQTRKVFCNPLFTRLARRYSSRAKQVTRNESKARKSPTHRLGNRNRFFIKCLKRHLNQDRKSTRLNSSHGYISYAVFCLKKKNRQETHLTQVN